MKDILIKTTESKLLEITLNRPEVRNAFNPHVIQKLTETFRNPPDPIKVIVLRGAGKSFCAGADLDWMKSMVQFTHEQNIQDSLQLRHLFETMKECPLPVITLVHGAAMGGALGLLACSDLVLAESSTQFCFSEVRLGLAPAVISEFVLARAPLGFTLPWMLSGKSFSAVEAQAMGLVHQQGSLSEVETALQLWTQSFLEAAPQAVRATKKLITNLLKSDPAEQARLTTHLIADLRVGAEGQEGLRAFLEKRSPSWKETLS